MNTMRLREVANVFAIMETDAAISDQRFNETIDATRGCSKAQVLAI